MAEHVEKVMNDMVPELDDLRRKRIFNDEELRQVVKRRRDFEYLLQKTESKPQDYLSYIRYEVALECLRSRRSKALHWRKRTISDFAGLRRLHIIFERGVRKFKGDIRMWYQYVDFCLRSGSTKVMSRVLLRALKFHPREVHLWLLAADRELKCGHIKAARALLVRGLRFAPKSPKLWGEFLRLEVRVACHLRDVRDSPHAALDASSQNSAPAESPWAPARLLFRQALSRMASNPSACAAFLAQARSCLQEAQSEPGPADGLNEWAEEMRSALTKHRPGLVEGVAWLDVPTDAAADLWELWWTCEVGSGSAWPPLVDDVANFAPATVLGQFASVLADCAAKGSDRSDTAGEALVKFAAASRASAVAETAVSILKALQTCAQASSNERKDGKEAAEKAYQMLAQRAVKEHPQNGRLALISSEHSSSSPSLLKLGGRSLEPDDASAMMLLQGDSDAGCTTRQHVLEVALRSLAPGHDPHPIVSAYLSQALARGGTSAFQQACQESRQVAAKLWDFPRCRAQLLASALDAELRCCSMSMISTLASKPGLQATALSEHFEELLRSLKDEDPAKPEWWIRYMNFVQSASSWNGGVVVNGLPTIMDLHWRAMRSVPDQAVYSEQAQRLLQQQSGGAC
mmetsp:Transcript_36558/g.104026  ORF Transcript_36558/g.104026 Transcript_36558/m.104026 type:complete len:631 (-) Transcript_36558:96-1988(-)